MARKPSLHLVDLLLQVWAARHLAHHHGHERRVVPPGAQEDLRDAAQLLVGRLVRRLDGVEALEQLPPVLAEDRLQHLLLGGEVVVEEPVRDARLLGDVPDARGVVAGAGEHPDGRVEDEPLLLARWRSPALVRLNGQSMRPQNRAA